MEGRLLAIAVLVASVGCAARLPPEELADLTQRAQAGDVQLQMELGDRYRDGRGVREDRFVAARWYRMASANGASAALTRLVCLGRGFFDRTDLLGEDGIFPTAAPRASAEGLTPPSLVTKADPKYTSDGMRAKLQGEVHIQAIVLTTGTIGELQITKSLDPTYGLDEQALCAALQWRFEPATRQGQPIASIVTLIMEFRLH